MKRKKPQKLPNVTSGMSDTDEDNNDNSAEQRQNAINQKYLQLKPYTDQQTRNNQLGDGIVSKMSLSLISKRLRQERKYVLNIKQVKMMNKIRNVNVHSTKCTCLVKKINVDINK